MAATYGFRRFWNAFSDIQDYSPMFYKADEPCVVGPCPDSDEVVADDAGTEGSSTNDTTSMPTGDDASGAFLGLYQTWLAGLAILAMVTVWF